MFRQKILDFQTEWNPDKPLNLDIKLHSKDNVPMKIAILFNVRYLILVLSSTVSAGYISQFQFHSLRAIPFYYFFISLAYLFDSVLVL